MDLIWYASWVNFMTRFADAFQLRLERDNVFMPPKPAEPASPPVSAQAERLSPTFDGGGHGNTSPSRRDCPGIVGPMRAYPEAARHLNALAEHLLRSAESLTPAEREMIAAYVSRGNGCEFCSNVARGRRPAPPGPGGRADGPGLGPPGRGPGQREDEALLAIADKVRRGGRAVTAADVARARREGADDRAVHDTVLIAAAFCMFNRYVDGLATDVPPDPAAYAASGARLGTHGYVGSTD